MNFSLITILPLHLSSSLLALAAPLLLLQRRSRCSSSHSSRRPSSPLSPPSDCCLAVVRLFSLSAAAPPPPTENDGKHVNILEGLELHEGVFSAVEQKRIVDFVHDLQEKGKRSELKERTYTAPQKWMKGKGRVTIQFGCCYNYAVDKHGNPPGILQSESVDPIPSLFKVMIRRLIRWHVLPPTCVPDSCIVNIYDEGDCIPPHIDNHDFVRPFCTVSFLSECNILFGSNLKALGPGQFDGSIAIPLPLGSVLILNGNGADIAKGTFETIHVQDSTGHEFATRLGNVFTIGKGTKPWASLPKGKGIKLSIIEEAWKRIAAQAAAKPKPPPQNNMGAYGNNWGQRN